MARGRAPSGRCRTQDIANLPRTPDGKVDFAQDFFGPEVFLTVSGQLNIEAYCLALTKVYTFGPTFRAENSNTSRHLAEFWMIEPKIAFADLSDNAALAEALLKYTFAALLNERQEDLAFFDQRIEKGLVAKLEGIVGAEFVHMDYGEAIEVLERANEKFEFPVHWGVGPQSERERYLTETYAKRPVIVMNYPKAIKAFYMRLNDDGRADSPGDVSSGLACGSLIATSLFPLKATLFGDLQRITGGLLTEMALVMPRTGRRADILVCMVPGRGDLSVRSRRCDHGRVFLEARQALLMELRIGNRTTLLAHSRLAEGAVCLQHSSVMVAMHDVLAGRRGISVGGHGHDRRQANRCESQTGRHFKNHDNHLGVGGTCEFGAIANV
jgi:hypothetical protein